MLKIEHMQIQLPSGFAHRANAIARLVGEEMAAVKISHSQSLERLGVPPLKVSANVTDQQIARRVVKLITRSLQPKENINPKRI